MDFAALAELCAPNVAVHTLKSIASVESSFNPYAIGVVGARLRRQPERLTEALATARMLEAKGYDYSVGLIQINQKNFSKYGLTLETAFDPCSNLRTGARIFQDCFERAGGSGHPLGDALSCYYSGNFKTGYQHGYVDKVLGAGAAPAWGTAQAIPVASKRPRSQKTRTARPPTHEILFVPAATPPVITAAPQGDGSHTVKGRETALLF